MDGNETFMGGDFAYKNSLSNALEQFPVKSNWLHGDNYETTSQ